jgi:hypothetical protein
MPAFAKTSISDADLAAIYSTLELARPTAGNVPLSYRISEVLTVRRVTVGLLLFVLISIILALWVTEQWVTRASGSSIWHALPRIGYQRAFSVGMRGLICDGFLAGWLFRRNKWSWLFHEVLLYGVPVFALVAVVLGGYDTARTDLTWSSPMMLVPATMAFAILVAALFVRNQYVRRRDFDTDAQFGLDYLFLDLLVLAILAGFLADGARRLGDVSWVQPTRLVHLALVATLLLSAPWTSFTHALVLPVLAGLARVREALESGTRWEPQGKAPADAAPVSLSGPVLSGMDPELRRRIRESVNAPTPERLDE